MADPYSAAAAGLESGFNMGRQARLDEERRAAAATERADTLEQRSYQRTRDAKADERVAAQDKRLADADARQKRLDELKVLDAELTDLNTEGSTLWQQHGGYDKVPADVRDSYTKRVREVRERRASARRSFYQPDVETSRKDAAETWSRIEAGQQRIEDLTPDQLYKAIQVQARRPMSDFLRSDPNKPSPVEQAALDLEAGMQTGNQDLILRAANVLLAPELRVGVGTPGRDGSEIVDKRIVRLAPHPQDPQQVVPILEVKVKREDGSVGTYMAPVTKGRGPYATDPEAQPLTLSIETALNRVGQLSALAGFVNRPEVQKALGSATEGKATADQFLEALGMAGVAPPKKQITRDRVDLGSHYLERELDASGNIIREQRLAKGAAPRQAEGPTAEERNASAAERRLAQAEKQGLITPDEAREKRRELALGGTKQQKGQLATPKERFDAENSLRDEWNAQSKTFTTIRDAYGKVLAAAKEQRAGPEPTAAADIALIFAYMRMLDPNSVVREGEFATAQNAAGIPDRVRNYYNRALSGNLLNSKQRAEIEGESRKVFDQQRKSQDEIDKRYRGMAERAGLDTRNVVGDMATPGELPPQAAAMLKEGEATTFGNGQVWTLRGGKPVQVQ